MSTHSPSSTSRFRCLKGCAEYPLSAPVYACTTCGGLLEVAHPEALLGSRTPDSWKSLFSSRMAGAPGPDGSGVWRYHEWVLPDLPREHIVTLGEGATPLVEVPRLGDAWGVRLLIKQCGHTQTGSFKDLGMTVLVSQVSHLRRMGQNIRAVVCASTGDTSAALAAYGAAADLRTLVLLPRGKITAAQLVQPLAHGARVLAIDTDFDGCMAYVQRLVQDEGVYLANSKNSLRIEGQKTVALEIAQGLGWQAPDWVAIPGGNLGNISALGQGFSMAKSAGLLTQVPRLLCAQAEQANPLYRSFKKGYAALEALTAGETQASAIRIGNPVSFSKAVAALQAAQGVVESVSEAVLTQVAREADACGLYVCPHTAVALAAVQRARQDGTLQAGATVVVVSTAHGLKFTEFKTAQTADRVAGVTLGSVSAPVELPDDYDAVRKAALG